MANLIRTFYEAKNGAIHNMLLKAATEAVAGTEPSGPATSAIRATVSKTNREAGLRARGIRIARLVGTAPDQFYKYAFIPLRSKADEADVTYNPGNPFTYNGSTWTIVAFQPEDT